MFGGRSGEKAMKDNLFDNSRFFGNNGDIGRGRWRK
jgi:hypothetical protein